MRNRKSVSVLDTSDLEAVRHAPTGDSAAVLDTRDVLMSMSPELRAATLLVDGEGFTVAAAANLCNVPQGTLATRVRKAREIIRAEIGKKDGQS